MRISLKTLGLLADARDKGASNLLLLAEEGHDGDDDLVEEHNRVYVDLVTANHLEVSLWSRRRECDMFEYIQAVHDRPGL
jgi:hypothetical protein